MKESEDHEVGMAMGQLEAMFNAIQELEDKIFADGGERNLPGWIQSHITSAYEYIKQANDNFHELEEAFMGDVTLPIDGQTGSGDVPSGSGEAEEEFEKKRKERMKYIKTFESFINESTEQVNEAVNASGYIKAGKLGYNDQFLGRQSLSRTLSLDLGLKASNEFVGPWIGFDHVSMYVSGKKGATILDDALSGKYTYDELKATAAEHMGIKESVVNEKVNMKKAFKELEKDSDGDYKVSFDDGTIEVEKRKGDNPWEDDLVYTFYWDGKDVWCDSDAPSSADYAEEVDSLSGFYGAMYDSDNWDN